MQHQSVAVDRPGPCDPAPLAPWRVRRAVALLHANLESGVSVDHLSAAVRLSPAHFSRRFKASTGLAPIQYLTRLRCAHAQHLLADRARPLSEVALASGFCDQAHFTRAFTRVVGQSPGAWRRAVAGRIFP